MKTIRTILSAILLYSAVSLSAVELDDVRYEQKDVENFKEVMRLLQNDASLPMDQTVMKVAKHFLGTPYVSYTIDIEPEKLTINTRETDCILFVEMCLAMSLTSKESEPTFEKYIEILKSLRYRNGKVDGYTSRLHYTSEWIIQGTANGYFREISNEIGGSPLDQHFFFMSTHPNSYKQVKNDPSLVEGLKKMEENLEGRDYWYIPKVDIPKCKDKIKDGDIIGFNCATPGLDIAHVAYAYWENGELTFIHASMSGKQVIVNKESLIDYTNAIKNHNGLRILRLNNR